MHSHVFDRELARLRRYWQAEVMPELRKRKGARSKKQARRYKDLKALKRYRKRQRNESMRPPKRKKVAPFWVMFN